MIAPSSTPGYATHRARLKRMMAIKDPVLRQLVDAAEVIRADIQHSITDGSISGPLHVASLPGQPPNADTHNLDLGIDIRVNPSRLTVTIAATAIYAAALEFGTSRIAERPYMRPGLRRNRNRLVFGTVQAVHEVVRVYKGS